MGYVLYREVLAHAPPDVTSGELVVWLVIADDANDTTRLSWLSNDALASRARMSADGVKRALQRLAARGYELRVARGKDKSGRLVYAYRGAQTTYRLPELSPGNGGTTVPALPEQRGDQGSAIGEKGGTTVPERGDHSPRMEGPQSPPSPQSPQIPSAARAAEQFVMDATGASPEEARAVVALVEQSDQPRRLGAFLRHLADAGELHARLQTARANRQRQHIAEWLAWAKTQPVCDPEHGVPGGDQIRPDTGEPQCGQCRARQRRARA